MIAVMKRAVILNMWNNLCLVSLACSAEGVPKCTDVFGRDRVVQFLLHPLPHPAVMQFLGARTILLHENFLSNFNINFSDIPKYEISRKSVW